MDYVKIILGIIAGIALVVNAFLEVGVAWVQFIHILLGVILIWFEGRNLFILVHDRWG